MTDLEREIKIASAAEARLAAALAALEEAREALEPFDFYDFDPADGWSDNDQLEIYVAETAMDAGNLLHRMKVCDLRKARAARAKLNALEGNEDG